VEGQALRDRAERFEQLDVTILGASFDPPAENLAFAEAQAFPFRLLSDVDRSVGTAYEVTRDPSEKFADFARRYSYLIDPDGMIHTAYDVTDVARHADIVIADVERAVAAR
jgi:peroxiredoxin Q/BCP